MTSYIYSQHALEQIERRNIKRSTIEYVLNNPDEILDTNDIRIYQGVKTENDKKCLYRIFVNIKVSPYVIITAYKTSKIDKYYEGEI